MLASAIEQQKNEETELNPEINQEKQVEEIKQQVQKTPLDENQLEIISEEITVDSVENIDKNQEKQVNNEEREPKVEAQIEINEQTDEKQEVNQEQKNEELIKEVIELKSQILEKDLIIAELKQKVENEPEEEEKGKFSVLYSKVKNQTSK